MGDSEFVKKIKIVCKPFGIESNVSLHFGRKIALAILDLEEVSELDKQSLGNCSTDDFGKVYSSKLPLAAMHVMTDSIRGVECIIIHVLLFMVMTDIRFQL